MSRRKFGLAAGVLLLAGCAVGPDFKSPEIAPTEWHSAIPHGGKVENLAHWWEQLNDVLLNELIVETEQHNPTLDMALAKMNEARANLEVTGGAFYPTLGFTAGSTRSRMAFGQQVILQTNHKAGFDASWELDLFGKNRRTAEAAQARFGVSEVSWHDARISLAAELADVYVELRQCEANLATAEQSQQSRHVVRELTDSKAAAGLATPLDLARAQAAEADADSAYRAKQGDCVRGVNRLSALSGIEPSVLQTRLAAQTARIPVPNEVDVASVAAQAVRQRPDVAIAEFNLAAASADIGASKAAIYPSLNLLGAVATNHIYMGGQNTVVPTWSFGPSLSIPIYSGGRAQASLAAVQARYDFAQANYQKTVREAVRNVEDSLVRLNVANDRARSAQQAQQNYQQLLQATESRYDAGLSNRIALEEARRSSLQAQDAAATMAREQVSAWIALYKALGGGWERATQRDTSAENNTKS
jgi:NodT family efflux transporter outer membrane factor (OMF) lipoprotein